MADATALADAISAASGTDADAQERAAISAWGTVTGLAPLRVQLDGDMAPLDLIPDALVSCAVGDRVACSLTPSARGSSYRVTVTENMGPATQLAHVHRVVAASAAAVIPTDENTTVEVTLDGSRQPAITARLSSTSTAWNVDPRTGGVSVDLTLTAYASDGGSVISTVTLTRLTPVTNGRERPTGEVELELASREAVIQQLASTSGSTIGPSLWAGIAEACEDLLRTYCGEPAGYADVVATAGAGISPTLVQGVSIRTGDRWWSLLTDLPQRTGRWLSVAPSGHWVLDPLDPAAAAHAGTLVLTPTSCRESVTRESSSSGQWADAVIVRYRWTASGTDHLIIGAAGSGSPTSVIVVDESVEATQAQADARAAQMLTQASRHGGRTWQVTAESDYTLRARRRYAWLPPGDTVPVTVYLAALTWSLPAGSMRLTLWEV